MKFASYVLRDPRDQSIIAFPFYVGKGNHDRVSSPTGRNPETDLRIQIIIDAGFSWSDIITVEWHASEPEAFYHEARKWERYSIAYPLTNIQTLSVATWQSRYREEIERRGEERPTSAALAKIEMSTGEAEDNSSGSKAVNLIWDLIHQANPDRIYSDILDPCAGIGELVNGHPATLIEKDWETYGKAHQHRKEEDGMIINADYLKWQASQKYDLIIMNPPFKLGSEMILKAVEELEEGGTLAFIMASNWRGFRTKHSKVYHELREIGRFESIYMLRRGTESKKYFSEVNSAIDLVIFTKGKKEGLTWTRNNQGKEFQFNQDDYPLAVPFLAPEFYDQIFSQDKDQMINPIVGYPRGTKEGSELIYPSYMVNTLSVSVIKSKKKRDEMNQPKIIYRIGGTCAKFKGIKDITGTEELDMHAYFIPASDFSQIDELFSLMQEHEVIKAGHMQPGSRTTLPPFKRSWFE